VHTFLDVLSKLDGILGVIVGAGLTYWFGVRNRDHQEEREDRTRWYNDRLQAYLALSQAFARSIIYMTQPGRSQADTETVARDFAYAVGSIRLLGSDEVFNLGWKVLTEVGSEAAKENADPYAEHLGAALRAFVAAARADLGFPASPANKRLPWLPWR
jgi:hypothetical protein